MSDLLTMLREHDLPPRWDGRLVAWRGWETQIPAFICPPPRQECCEACGSIAPPVTNRGLVALSPATTQDDIDADRENRGLLGASAYRRKNLALWRLHAFRCTDCKHDVVWDRDTDEWWNLDHTDYGNEGSSA